MQIIDFQTRPIDQWPGQFTKHRKRSPFSVGYGTMKDDLDRELQHLQARGVAVLLALREQDIRFDGRPRAGAKVTHPGVIVVCETKHGPLRMACDTFDEWTGNLRAITLTLKNLRLIDNYGCTRRGEQYRGWTALPPPEGVIHAPGPVATMTKDEAIRFLAEICEYNPERIAAALLRNPSDADVFVRQAAAKTHPDRGGDPEKFKKVMQAKAVLEGSK